MDKQEITYLFNRYLNNNCTKEELQQLLKHFNITQHEDLLRELVIKQLGKSYEEGFEEQLAVKNAFSKTDNFLLKQLAINKIKESKWKRYKYASIAASVIFILIGISYYYITEPALEKHKKEIVKSNQAPGKSQATLTLANGQTIKLDDKLAGEIVEQSDIKVYKQQDGQLVYQVNNKSSGERAGKQIVAFNTIRTPKGGQYQVVLPDGSKVWLNAASSLRFPVSFTGEERIVELTGEAYFDISKNMKKPFLVKTAEQLVRVLGTQFNINNYEDAGGVKTTLVEGKIAVSINNTKDGLAGQRILKPGQQALVKHSIEVKQANMEEALAWRNGWFVFNDAYLKDILKQLTRWYAVEVDWESVPHLRYNGAIPRNVNLSKALEMLEKTSTTSFKLTEGKITCKETSMERN